MTVRAHRRLRTRCSARVLAAALTLGLLLGVVPGAAAYADPVGVPPSGKPGTLLAWGTYGSATSSVPARLQHRLFKAVAAADGASLALTVDGQVVAWGDTDTYGVQTIPTSLTGKTVTAIAADGDHALALTSDGSVIGWGDNTYGQSAIPASLTGKKVVAIAAGNRHSLALTDAGAVVAWGLNTDGQTAVPGSLAGVKVTAIAAGYAHSLALTAAGTVIGWGSNVFDESVSPPALVGKVVTAISAGRYGSLALTSDQAVVAWGNDEDGQLGVARPAGSGVVALAAGSQYNIVLDSGGAIEGAGYQGSGEQVLPPSVQNRIKLAVAVNGGHNVALAEPKVAFVPPDSLDPDNGLSATVGLPYRHTYVADGYPAPTITLATGSTLPPGLTLATDGTLSGTPTTYGSYTFTLRAQNATSSDEYEVTVSVSARVPVQVAAVSGSGQTAAPGQAFAKPLVAKITDEGGYPATGPVLFTLPTTPGAPTFEGGTSSSQPNVEAGVVTTPTIVAGTQVGTFTVTAKLLAPFDAVPATSYTLVVTTPAAGADLGVSLAAPPRARTRHQVTVTVQLRNAGPDAASAVRTRLRLPSGWKVLDPAGGVTTGRSVTWSAPTLAAAGSTTYAVTLRTGHHRGRATLEVSTGSAVPDPTSTDNRASVHIRLTR